MTQSSLPKRKMAHEVAAGIEMRPDRPSTGTVQSVPRPLLQNISKHVRRCDLTCATRAASICVRWLSWCAGW
jgi:hypothetical protein